MNRLPSLLVFFMGMLIFFSACNDSKKEAEQNYKELSAINDSLYHYGQQWTDLLPDAVNTKNFTSLSPLRQAAEDFVESKLVHLRSIDEDGSFTNLKKAEINYLLLEKDIIHEGFGAFEQFNPETPDSLISDAYADLLAMIEQEEEEQQRLRSAFKEYAEQHEINTDKK